LEAQNLEYNVAILESDVVSLPSETGALRTYDGNNLGGSDTYITPDEYWETTYGIQKTQSVVNTGWFNLSMWSWCGQQSDNSEATVQQYLDTLNQFESQYPNMRFIYMTGPTDGTGAGGTSYRNNDLVRQYVRITARYCSISLTLRRMTRLGKGPTSTMARGSASGARPGAKIIQDIAMVSRIPAFIRTMNKSKSCSASSRGRHSGG